jgi:hypothetical protein
LLIIPRRAAKHFVSPLTAAQAQGQVSAADFIINDLRRYWAYAAVLEMFAPSPLMAEREGSLAQLAEGVPCFALGLTAGMGRDEVRNAVVGLLPLGGVATEGGLSGERV